VPAGRAQGVAKNFREIFAALAAGGKGELVMQKRLHGPAAPAPAAGLDGDGGDCGDEQAEAGGVAEKYVGVKVKVRLLGPRALQSAAVQPRALQSAAVQLRALQSAAVQLEIGAAACRA